MCCESPRERPSQLSQCPEFRAFLEISRVGFISIYPERALFVDVGMAHGYYDRVDGDIHHYHVQNLQADAKRCDGDNVEAAGADGESLKKSI